MTMNELNKSELSLLIELVGNYARDLDEALCGSQDALEKPTALAKRYDEAEALYQKLFQEVYGK